MNINIGIERSLLLPVPYSRAASLLDDLEGTISRFPNLKKLTPLGPQTWLWEMQTMGSHIAKIAHDLSYAARYSVDAKAGTISWQPVPGKGNASIGGEIQIAPSGDATTMRFKVKGVLNEVPVPLLYRPLAPTFISGKMSTLIERFLAVTGEALAAEAAVEASPKPKRVNGKQAS